MLSNPDDLLGHTIGGYRLEAKLGAGATGVVFYGHAADGSQTPVAVKLLVIPLNASAADRVRFEKRFRREAEMLRRLRHPRILRLLSFGEEAGCFYIVLPYMAGGTLAARMMSLREPLPLNLVAWYLNEMASALDYAHSQGVIHRDLKPGNMLLDTQGQPFLADFSIARLLDPTRTNLTQTGQVLGTLEYLSPEQAGGEDASLASDIYSLGVVVYELLTGRVPFQGKSFGEVFKKHTQEQPPPPRTLRPDLPEAAEAVILQALAKSPAERFSSAGAFAQAFVLGLQGQWTPGVRRPEEGTTPFIPPPTVNVPSEPPAAPETGRFITPPTVRVESPQQPDRSTIPQAPVGGSMPPGVTAPVALPKKSRAGLIALVVVLLVVAAGGVFIVLGVNHQGPIASLFPGGRSPTSTSAVTVTPQPMLSATVTTPATATSSAQQRPGIITEFRIPTAHSEPWNIAAGRDGNLWFTEGDGNNIGRITLQGAITEFAVPTAHSAPEGIAAGPDGNLWFAEYGGNKIGRITPQGGIIEFPIPTARSLPEGIAAGPDGNLWFTEYSSTAHKIGRITLQGAITEFLISTTQSGPHGIAAGPDGNLWFTEFSGNKIGRITPQGTITEFPIATAGSDPSGITAGPDGNLWFTEILGNKIGRITPGGIITEFPTPTTLSNPRDIAAGPDENLWFTESNGNANAIGRITSGT